MVKARTNLGAASRPLVDGGKMARLRKCAECGGHALLLMRISFGPERSICAICMGREAPEGAVISIPCAIEGCEMTPEYIIKEQMTVLHPFALCGSHFEDYNGVICQIFRLPKEAGSGPLQIRNLTISLWDPQPYECGYQIPSPKEIPREYDDQ